MSQHDDDLQKRFDEQADELGLRPDDETGGWGDERSVGKAFAVQPIVEVEVVPDDHDGDDAQQVEEVITLFESTGVEEFPAVWDQVATDPFVVVGFGWVASVDRSGYESHLHELQQGGSPVLAAMGPAAGREVQVKNLKVTSLGPGRAVATYRVDEKMGGGNSKGGNGTAILVHVTAGWRITVIAKSERFLDLLGRSGTVVG